jgi:16S rRNA G1207 methylase RsmC
MKMVVHADFLASRPSPVYDRICMNPPFAPRQADIRHVSHAMGFLKPGGRLVAIMSAGTMFRQNSLAVAFRATLGALNASFTDLPPGSFKESGTMVNACIVTVELPK